MKKGIFIVLLFIALGINYSFSGIKREYLTLKNITIENCECKYTQCSAIAKSTGKRCKHCVSNAGDSYCWQHD